MKLNTLNALTSNFGNVLKASRNRSRAEAMQEAIDADPELTESEKAVYGASYNPDYSNATDVGKIYTGNTFKGRNLLRDRDLKRIRIMQQYQDILSKMDYRGKQIANANRKNNIDAFSTLGSLYSSKGGNPSVYGYDGSNTSRNTFNNNARILGLDPESLGEININTIAE
jgi:hypothetical protein